MSKIWSKEEIKELLIKSDKAVSRAVLALYKRQTADEQRIEGTKHQNSVGFNSADASYLSYCAKWIEKRGDLTGSHVTKARNKILKYAGQLADISNQNETAKVAVNSRGSW